MNLILDSLTCHTNTHKLHNVSEKTSVDDLEFMISYGLPKCDLLELNNCFFCFLDDEQTDNGNLRNHEER